MIFLKLKAIRKIKTILLKYEDMAGEIITKIHTIIVGGTK
jgi:hypothetical protein